MINCYICGKRIFLNNIIALANRMIICKQCFAKNNGFICKYCNFKYIGQDYEQTEQCCKYCADGIKKQKENKQLKFHNSYFKPYPTFYPNKKENTLYLGIQLQMGGIDEYDIVNKFAAYNENYFFYIKKDASIPQYGCEIVSYPATVQYHLSSKSKWKEILTESKKNGFKSYDIENCGLHIHVNRDFFSKNEIAKLDQFVCVNKSFFEKISKRTSDFSRYLTKPDELYGVPINQNRYCALNLCTKDTIQFRMFKGTLKYESVMAYIEFVYNLCNYVKTKNDLTIDDFLNYINNNYNMYLSNFIKKIGK